MTDGAVWVLGRWKDEPSTGWEVQGVFTSRDKALAEAHDGWFVGAVELDVALPVETVAWPNVEYA